MVFVFEFVYTMIFLMDFCILKPFLHPWNEAYLTMMDDHFHVFLDSVSENFIEYFCSDIHKRSWSEVLFLCWVFIWIKHQSNCGFIKMNWIEYLLFPFWGIVCAELELDLL